MKKTDIFVFISLPAIPLLSFTGYVWIAVPLLAVVLIVLEGKHKYFNNKKSNRQ